jgi:hypothetical protein
MESLGYALHAPVWWTRRIVGASRKGDAKKVAAFLVEKGLWDKRRGTATAVVSASALRRLDIERKVLVDKPAAD